MYLVYTDHWLTDCLTYDSSSIAAVVPHRRTRQRAYACLAYAADDKRHAWVDQSGTTPDAKKLLEAH